MRSMTLRLDAVMRCIARVALLATLLNVGYVRAETNGDLLQAIVQRGQIVIGVKTDFAPFGQLDSTGQPIGMEIDLANQIASAMGLKAKIVGVTTTNRFERLEQGAVDMVIATAGDTIERRKLATAIEPNYFAAGVGVMLRPGENVTSWEAIRGKTLCAVQGAYFNRAINQRYILDLQMYPSVRNAMLAMQEGRCIGFLYSDLAIAEQLHKPEWQGYKSTLPSTLVVPWAIFVPRQAANTEYANKIGEIVAALHRDGTLKKLAATWKLPPNPFLDAQQKLWSRRDKQGQYECTRNAQGQWPDDCRHRTFVTTQQSGALGGVGLWLKETLSLNVSVLYDPYDRGRYLKGIGMTLLLIALSSLCSLLLGYFGAKVAINGGWKAALLRSLANLSRMTPPLLQMYLLFFGVGGAISGWIGHSLPPMLVAVLTLSLYHGSMIMYAMIEAAQHIREDQSEFVLTRHNLNELMRHAAVGTRTALSNLSKAVSVASAIAVPELLSSTIAIISDQGNAPVMMNLLLIVFFLISSGWMLFLHRLETKLLSLREKQE